MSARELIVLGTASQVPTRYRNHNGYFLRWGADGLLFDPGEGTQRQMTIAGLAASQIHHIFVTHFHGDHALGLAGVIQRISLDRVGHTVHIYYPASGQVYFDRLRYSTIYMDMANIQPHPIKQPGVIAETPSYTIEAHHLDHGAPFSPDSSTEVEIPGYKVEAHRLSHNVETFGYSIREHDSFTMLPEKLEHFGIRYKAIAQLVKDKKIQIDDKTVHLSDVSIPRPGQRFAFIMDTRPCAGATRLAERADLLVCESTYLHSEQAEAWDHYHMTALQAAELAVEAQARRLVLGHFSQRYPDLRAFHEEAAPIFPDVHVAADFDRVAMPARRAI